MRHVPIHALACLALVAVTPIVYGQTLEEEPGAFDETKLKQDIQDVSFGTRATLEAGTYYVRSQVFLPPSWFLQGGVYKPAKVIGHTETITGNFDGIPGTETKTVYNTRVVCGVPVYSRHWRTWANLPATDLSKNRFPSWVTPPSGAPFNPRTKIYWVDIPEWMANNGHTQPWFPGLERTGTEDNSPVNVRSGWKALNQYDNDTDNVPVNRDVLTATIGGLPLKFAEMADDPGFSTNPMTGRWARASGGAGTTLIYDPQKAFGTGRTGYAFGTADTSGDMRMTVFHHQDYRSVTVGVNGAESIIPMGGGAGGVELQLGANPFSASIDGIDWYESNQAYNVQRFRLWNVPEFLWKPGTMVINTVQRRIYFIAPTAIAEEDYKLIDWKRKDTSQTHTINSSEPYYYSRYPDGSGTGNGIQTGRQPTPVGEDSLLELSIPKLQSSSATNLHSECIKFDGGVSDSNPTGLLPSILIQDVKFGNGLRTGVNIENANNVTVKNSFFRNFGGEGLKIKFSKNVTVDNCLFRGAYRHMLALQNGKMQTTTGIWEAKDSDAFKFVGGQATLIPDLKHVKFDAGTRDAISNNILVKDCTFEQSGEVYPEAKGLRMYGYPVGTVIDNCKFKDMSAVAVHVSGINTTVKNCNFQNVCKDVTDSAAIYAGRSWMKLGTFVDNNWIENTYRSTPNWNTTAYYGTWSVPSEGQAAAVEMDSRPNACVYFDDNQFGGATYMNDYRNSAIGVKINRGRFMIADDLSHSSVVKMTFLLPNDEPGNSIWSGLDTNQKAYYQNYRELGSLFGDPAFGIRNASGAFIGYPENWGLIMWELSNRSWVDQESETSSWTFWDMSDAFFRYFTAINGGGATGGREGAFPISRFLMTDENAVDFTGFKTINNSPAYKNGYIAKRN